MKTLVFPGFSIKNKAWAEEVAEKVDSEIEVINWPHWEEGGIKKNWKEAKVEDILKRFEGQEVNVIAKSVGTIVAMMVLQRNPKFISKLILCGVPVAVFDEGDENLFKILYDFPSKNLLCIQNDNDPLASFEKIEAMLHLIKPDIKIISKPASTHDYPYFDEFKNFLK